MKQITHKMLLRTASIALYVIIFAWAWSSCYTTEYRMPPFYLGQVTYYDSPNGVVGASPDTIITSMISFTEGQFRFYINRIIPTLGTPENSIIRFRASSKIVLEPISSDGWFPRLGLKLPKVSWGSQENGSIATFALRVPLWFMFMSLVVLRLVLRKKLLVRMGRVACAHCDYDLRGCVGSICPECGASILAAQLEEIKVAIEASQRR